MSYNIPYDTDYKDWYGSPVNVARVSAQLVQTKNEDGDPIGRISASWDVPDNGGVFNILLSTDGTNYKLEMLNVNGNSAVMDVAPDTGYYMKVVTVMGGNKSTGTVIQVPVATIPTPSAPVLVALSDGIQIDAGIMPIGYSVRFIISDGTNSETIDSAERITMYICDSGNYSVTAAYVDVNGNAGTYSTASTISVSGVVDKNSSDYIKGAAVTGNTLTLTKGSGDTVTFENTTYSDFVGSGESAAHGLVPAPPTTAGTTKFLCEDGSWEVPAGGGGGGGSTYTAGDGIDITNDVISLETASTNDIGGIKVGSGLSIDANGVLSAIGGGSYTETVLFSNPSGGSGTINLSGKISDYDFISFSCIRTDSATAAQNEYLFTSSYLVNKITEQLRTLVLGFSGRYITFYVTSGQVITTADASSDFRFSKIVGIKVGGGGSTDSLFSQDPTITPPTNTDIVFSHPWSDYDLLVFRFGSANRVDCAVSKQTLADISGTSNKFWFSIYNGHWYYSSIIVVNSTTIRFATSSYSLGEIIGIKT